MVNWLLQLAVYGLIVSVATGVDIFCSNGLSSWKFEDFKNCRGNIIHVDGGNGIADLSTWSDTQLINIFSQKELVGGFIISNSQITGKGVVFNLASFDANVTIVIENNPKLEAIAIDMGTPLYIRVSGNRQLKKEYILSFEDLKSSQEIRNDSHIQAYHECNLNGDTVTDVKAGLANCAAIYGNLVFDANTVFPQNVNDWKSIEPLEYIEGCLRITGTQLESWDDITFLENTKYLGGCKTGGHEISGNQKMCIQPPLAHKLTGIFPGLTIVGNNRCTPECSNTYLHQTADSSCVIITDSLVINDNTTSKVLEALAKVEEIRGTFQMANTSLTKFNYLPKLQKLNSDKLESGAVISIQFNRQLKSFDLPLLNKTGLFVGRNGQLKYQDDENDFKTDPAFLQRIGANRNETLHVPIATTTQSTTAASLAVVPTVKPIPLNSLFMDNLVHIIIVLVFTLIFASAVVFTWYGYRKKWWQLASNWHWYPMGDDVDQTDIYKYDQESEWHKEARKQIASYKPQIEERNLEHKSNTEYKKLTFYNHMGTQIMPGPLQKVDFEKRKHLGDLHFYDSLLKFRGGLYEEGLYGLAFEKKIETTNPDKNTYRTECDLFGYKWFKGGMSPVYPEYFESTAKLMAKLPCDMIGEKIEYMKIRKIDIGEFGITGLGFKAAVTVDEKDPVPSRAKKEETDVFWFGDQIPQVKIHRYREKLNNLKISGKKFTWSPSENLDQFICRLTEALMNLPTKQNLNLTVKDIDHFLKVVHPYLFGDPVPKKKYPRAKMSVGEWATQLNKTHVRIVGEIRGDFDALRRALNIPSLLNGKEHPLLQYNWVFLGNYTGRHPQSLETIIFLMSLQFLYGRDCIILLRGVMEYTNTSEKYGFKDNLKDRFGDKDGIKVWERMMKAMSKLPSNCKVLYGAYCSSGGFLEGADAVERKQEPKEAKKTEKEESDDEEESNNEESNGGEETKKEESSEAGETKKEEPDGQKTTKKEEPSGPEKTTKRDAAGKEKKAKSVAPKVSAADVDAPSGDATPPKYHESTTPKELDKLFSLPNVTVKDYLENADTGAGYYYGERALLKIARMENLYTFFSTMPMMGGVGFFSDSSAAQLITISSVRHLHGHGGQKTLLAAVAEINGDTNVIILHTILHEDEMFQYDGKTDELRKVEDNQQVKVTASTSPQFSKEGAGTCKSTSPAETKSTSPAETKSTSPAGTASKSPAESNVTSTANKTEEKKPASKKQTVSTTKKAVV